jgi:N6-L-threonylcarbamoyladenine synthase
MTIETVLGIETSCDETAASVVNKTGILTSVVSSQIDIHKIYGGVLPELASRNHLRLIVPIMKEALNGHKVDGVAATMGPGLIGSLLVGFSAAKTFAYVNGLPFIGVNHHEAHLFAAFLEHPVPELPAIVLLVAGGHTMLILMKDVGRYVLLGKTVDDAAGEAFDKVARYLGLGYPGGPVIDKVADEGSEKIDFPRPLLKEGYDFSFSGLKTAVIRYVQNNPSVKTEDVAASFRRAVVDVLMDKAIRSVKEFKARSLVLAGGVAANALLRHETKLACEKIGVFAGIPDKKACTDNAAMVAAAGLFYLQKGKVSEFSSGVDPNLKMCFEQS